MDRIKNIYKNKWFRVFGPFLLIVLWLVVAGFGGPTFGKIQNVVKNDQASYLPTNAESTKAQNEQLKFYGSDTIPAIVVLESKNKFEPTALATLPQLAEKLRQVDGVDKGKTAVMGPIPSKDGKAVEFIVQVGKDRKVNEVVDDLRKTLDWNTDSSVNTYVTGPAGVTGDFFAALSGIDGLLLVVALAVVFVILLIVYRSVFLPFIVLINAMLALVASILIIYQLASHNLITLNSQGQGILSILVIGAATDYSLLFIARYKEALHHVESKWVALVSAYKGSFEAIIASSATVVAALLCLLFSDLNSNRSLGPIASVGIIFAFIATMTLLPTLLVIFGRNAFWPLKPKYEGKNALAVMINSKSLWGKTGTLIKKHYRIVWVTCVVVLLAFAFGATQFKASGISQSDNMLSKSNSVDGQKILAKHFPAGSGSPAGIIVKVEDTAKTLEALSSIKGVSTSMVYTGGSPFAQLPPKIINDKVMINAVLTHGPDTDEAENTIKDIRKSLKDNSIQGLVGGESAIMLDSNTTAHHDLYKIVPIILVVILVILMLLLRSILSAVILIGTVILSYFSTLGVAALVFNHIFHFPGSDPAVPLFSFVFLVALGVDYNIFLMTRIQEESKVKPTREAIIHALEVTGGLITSAGVVLAATFAALSVIPILFLAQVSFLVAFGVLLDTIIVRSLLLSSLTYDLGSKIWWPNKRYRKP